jgi:Cu2+-containing amine oxidase
MSAAGSVTWPSAVNPVWRFNWALADAPDAEGIVISQAYFRGREVFYKASLPSLRVQYDGPCGPYKDPLNYGNAHPTSNPASRVAVYSVSFFGFSAAVVEAYHTIGNYRLTERWYFWIDGTIAPRMSSAGLQCNYDHRHHLYWRFDFDIDGAGNDLALEYNTSTPDLGWGPGWHTKQHEIVRVKNPATRRCWAILDKGSQRGYMILPGPHDGVADAFSSGDLWVLRYHGSEDQHGRQGSASNDALAPLLTGEPTDGQDLVLWYCAHLSHEASDGGDDVHTAGPDLIPFRY